MSAPDYAKIAREAELESWERRLAEYRSAVTTCVMAAHALAAHDLPAFLEDIERADSAGPFVDPTLWMTKRRAMREDAEILRAALPLHQLGCKLREK